MEGSNKMKKSWIIKVTYLIDGEEKTKDFPQSTAKVDYERLIKEIRSYENISPSYVDFSVDEFLVELA